MRTIGSLFFDSGAHSLYNEHAFSRPENASKKLDRGVRKHDATAYDFYQTPEFWNYVDAYGEFVKANEKDIDHYVNVDVIHNARLTYRVQKYLEKKYGIKPIPVIHAGTDLKWLDKYLDDGHDYIALGGVALHSTKVEYLQWADHVFDFLCRPPTRLPCVKVHGFAVTFYKALVRYPWWSVDSTSWAKAAGYGNMYVPHLRRGIFDFTQRPYTIGMSSKSHKVKLAWQHYNTVPEGMRKVIHQWLEEIEMTLDQVQNSYPERALANLKFFEQLGRAMPEWPWPFRYKRRRGFFY